MTFINSQFPMANFGSSGGPSYKTSITESVSGSESRNGHWSLSRREFDAAFQVRTQADLDTVIKWFHACRGRLHSFRFKDWSDYKSVTPSSNPSATDQGIGTGDGVETVFQLVKAYTVGSQTQLLNITKPVSGTLLVAVNSVTKTETTHYTVDYSTGVITFLTAPGNALPVTAGYEYDLECRFNTDSLSASIDDYNVYSSSIPIIEVR